MPSREMRGGGGGEILLLTTTSLTRARSQYIRLDHLTVWQPPAQLQPASTTATFPVPPYGAPRQEYYRYQITLDGLELFLFPRW